MAKEKKVKVKKVKTTSYAKKKKVKLPTIHQYKKRNCRRLPGDLSLAIRRLRVFWTLYMIFTLLLIGAASAGLWFYKKQAVDFVRDKASLGYSDLIIWILCYVVVFIGFVLLILIGRLLSFKLRKNKNWMCYSYGIRHPRRTSYFERRR